MTKIRHLELPKQFPTVKALKSKNAILNYTPMLWEFQYEANRYLKHISNQELEERYRDIKRNIYVLVSENRNIIPIESFLSSWYWYRKEHQTRYEFFLRKHPFRLEIALPRGNFQAPIRAKGPNSCDMIFRYGEFEFMNLLIKKGGVRIRPASYYKDGEKYDPRTDNELNKSEYLLGEKAQVTLLKNGQRLPVIGNLKQTYNSPNFYTLCLATDFEPTIFDEFSYDTCVIIKDPKEFALRLKNATQDKLKDWYFIDCPIEYYDPYEPTKNRLTDPTMTKDFRFAYQMEYRVVWHPMDMNKEVEEYIDIGIGSLEDICELYTINK